MQIDIIGGVAVKTYWVPSFFDSNNFNQSVSNLSLWIIRFEAMVYWLKTLVGSLGPCKDLRGYFLELEAFDMYITQSVQKSINAPYMEVFLIDS